MGGSVGFTDAGAACQECEGECERGGCAVARGGSCRRHRSVG